MVLFQRIKTPFAEAPADSEAAVPWGPRSAGDVLRQQREESGLTLEQVAAALKIKPAYLEALEEGKPDGLPGPAYAVGFARSYSNYLGLDSAEILRRMRAGGAEFGAKPDLSFPMPLGEKSLPSGGLIAIALVLAVCAYGGWYYLSNRARLGAEKIGPATASLLPKPKPTPPATKSAASAPAAAKKPFPTLSPAAKEALAALASAPRKPNPTLAPAGQPPKQAAAQAAASRALPAAPPTPPATRISVARLPAEASPSMPPAGRAAPVAAASEGSPASPAGSSSAVPEAPPAAKLAAVAPAGPTGQAAPAGHTFGAENSRIVIRALRPSWIEVRAPDRSILFVRVLKPGESYRVPDEAGLTLWTGNAGALAIAVDGKPAPPLRAAAGVLRNVPLEPQALLGGKASGG